MESPDILSVLIEIRDAIRKHQEYIEERDKWQLKAASSQLEDYKKAIANSNGKYYPLIFFGIMVALFMIAIALISK